MDPEQLSQAVDHPGAPRSFLAGYALPTQPGTLGCTNTMWLGELPIHQFPGSSRGLCVKRLPCLTALNRSDNAPHPRPDPAALARTRLSGGGKATVSFRVARTLGIGAHAAVYPMCQGTHCPHEDNMHMNYAHAFISTLLSRKSSMFLRQDAVSRCLV